MGTTIRRQPVNFDIPASPNYKFLNITNFRGLDVSSNPFELASNTASDCLNVYVDETNTLTTRPRLEKKVTTPGSGEHIATYNLHNGYLLHYLQDGKGVMHKLINGTKTEVKGIIPTTKCKYFEQGDKIYLLDKSRYMVIDDNNTLSNVVGYVPTTAVVDLNGVRHDVEPINLLTDKYVEKYHWDGISKYDYTTPNTVSVTNKYYNEKSFETFIPIMTYDDYSAFGYYFGETALKYVEFDPKKEFVVTDLGVTLTSSELNNTTMMSAAKGFWRYSGTTLRRYIYNGDGFTTKDYTASATIQKCITSPNGTAAIITLSNGRDVFVNFNMTGTDIEYSLSSRSQGVLSNNYYYIAGHDVDNNKTTIYRSSLTGDIEFVAFDEIDYRGGVNLQVTPDDALLIVQTTQSKITDPFVITTYSNQFSATRQTTTVTLPANIQTTSEGLLYGVSHENFEPSKMFVVPDYTRPNEYYFVDYGDTTFGPDEYNSSVYYMLHYNIFKNKYIVISNRYSSDIKSKYFIYNASEEPLIEVTNKKTEDSADYEDWQSKREQFFQSYLNTRFDNNYWFASKNRYYRSANNDPTYFPITEYNDLGDSNEEITGFNLANDTTLIAYKKNRVYLIQPFTSSLDTTEYAITESKNTVGNTAFGSPIVTTLTEIPLQINNDGVYGLSQLSNVSATERIADLMSEPINERWLNIDDTLITNAQTLNRLYWTYIILPDNNNKQTMIYLLDNRSNSWYYWELPIVVSDSFVKDNRAEFVDVAGNIYYLTTTDIIDINYDEEKVTKYYDEGNKLIPWFWQSQVLPMGTMNYSKRLVNTTFILTDTDDSDGYGLQYNFKVFRKLASSTPEKEISDKLTLVRSTTKKTNISKFGFLQMRISNLTEESRDYEAFENNKLRLVGLGLKYVLLEGLIR